MKILLAVHHFPPRYRSGAELHTLRLARRLLADGHSVEVVCIESLDEKRSAGVEAERDIYEGIPVWRLHLGLHGAPANWTYANPMVADWVGRHVQAWRPNLFHLHSGYLIGAGVLEEAHRLNVPTIVTLHDYWFLCPRFTLLRGDGRICDAIPADPAGCAWCLKLDQRRYRLPDRVSRGVAGRIWIALAGGAGRNEQAARRAYLRRALHLTSLALAPSRFLADHFAGMIAPERLRVIRLGVDRAILRQTPPPSFGATLRLAYIGQIAQHKGVHVVIEAVRRLPHQGRPVELRIYGNLTSFPTYVRRLRAQIGADRRIRLEGPFTHDQIPAVLGNADVVVTPSIWYENSPLVIMEAHAAGRPVIASRLGGMAELVRDGVDGLLFRPGDVGDLARQIQRLRDEAGLLERLCAGVRPPPSIDEEMAELQDLYRMAIEQHRAA